MARSINKSKRNSILNFVAVVILTIIGIVLSVGNFKIPFTNYVYQGFANSISLGLDLAGGVSVVYNCDVDEGQDLDKAIDATVTRLSDVIGSRYSEADIRRQGTNQIRIEVPSVTDSEAIFDLIGDPTPLYMLTENTATTMDEAEEKGFVRVVGTDIKDVFVSYQNDAYGVTLVFTDEGKQKFADLTEFEAANTNENGSDQKIYVYIGEVGGQNTKQLTLTCEEAIKSGSTFISGDDFKDDYDAARNYALTIMSGTFNAKLDLFQSTIVSATLGADALKYCIIGGFVGLILIMAILWWRYGDFGLLAGFALVIYVILMLFFLQAISFVQLTLPGLAGIVLSIGMAVDGTVIIFERVREEYKSGKKIPLSVKGGFKRAFWPIFDSNITTIITAVVLYILGTASIQGFAITLLIGILLSMFMNLVVLRFFVKWYLPFNSVKGKKLHLPKQERQAKDVVVEGGLAND